MQLGEAQFGRYPENLINSRVRYSRAFQVRCRYCRWVSLACIDYSMDVTQHAAHACRLYIMEASAMYSHPCLLPCKMHMGLHAGWSMPLNGQSCRVQWMTLPKNPP